MEVSGPYLELSKLFSSLGALAITFVIQWIVVRTAVVSALKRFDKLKK